jgi:ABC-type polysaccharide/polyol phosphate export permease
MSTTSVPLTDSRIMLRRNLKHILRNPVTIFNGALMPVVIMLMFVYVLGNAFNVGEHYIEYATPGLILLPFVSSAIVPAAKMGQGVRQFAEYQPFTPIIESLRGLLAGTPSGGYAAAALAWCAGIALVGYLWSRATFSKRA